MVTEKTRSSEAQLDALMTQRFAELLSDLRPLAEYAAVTAAAAAAKGIKGGEGGVAGANISRAVDAYNDSIDGASEALGEFPLALQWRHCMDIETAARRLSKLVFEGNHNNEVSRTQEGGGNGHGAVEFSFSNVRTLWDQKVAFVLCAQEAEGDNTAVPSMKSAVTSRNAVIALLSPGTHMGTVQTLVSRNMTVAKFERLDSFRRGGTGTAGSRHRRTESVDGTTDIDLVVESGEVIFDSDGGVPDTAQQQNMGSPPRVSGATEEKGGTAKRSVVPTTSESGGPSKKGLADTGLSDVQHAATGECASGDDVDDSSITTTEDGIEIAC